MDKLKELYYNPKEGFISFEKLYSKVKENKLNLTYTDVKDFYKSQAVNQVMKPI